MKNRLMPFMAFLPVAAMAMYLEFTNVRASIEGDHLVVNFQAQASPATASAEFQARATAKAVWGCVNRGGNRPHAANKRKVVTRTVTGSDTVSDAGGEFTGAINLDTPESDLQCPPGQESKLMEVSFSNVKVWSETLKISRMLSGTFHKRFPIERDRETPQKKGGLAGLSIDEIVSGLIDADAKNSDLGVYQLVDLSGILDKEQLDALVQKIADTPEALARQASLNRLLRGAKRLDPNQLVVGLAKGTKRLFIIKKPW